MYFTNWFPDNSRPVRVGPYQTRLDANDRHVVFQYWNGTYWGHCGSTAEDAALKHKMRSAWQDVEWRGQTE